MTSSSYEWLSDDGKRARFLALLGALEAIEADVQILRVGRRWRASSGYAREVGRGRRCGPQDPAVGATRARAREALRAGTRAPPEATSAAARPALFLVVSLRDPERDVASYVSRAAEQHPREWWAGAQARILACATGAC